MLDILKTPGMWLYLMYAGIILVAATTTRSSNGRDTKQRQLIMIFKQQETSGQALGRPIQQMRNWRAKPIMLIIGILLCLVAYVMLVLQNGVIGFAIMKPLTASLFLIPVIILIGIILITLHLQFGSIIIYEAGLVKKSLGRRKLYCFSDFDRFEISVYVHPEINYRAFSVNPEKSALKLWLRKCADLEPLYNAFNADPKVKEIIVQKTPAPFLAKTPHAKNRSNTEND